MIVTQEVTIKIIEAAVRLAELKVQTQRPEASAIDRWFGESFNTIVSCLEKSLNNEP